jgi:serine/threonine-protein kinase
MVNDVKVRRHELRNGDVVQVGSTRLEFRQRGTFGAAALAPESALADPATPKASAETAEHLGHLVGQELSHYRVGPVLAKGRTGLVFRGTDQRDGKDVAIKVLGPEFAGNDECVQRFIRAMKTMVGVRHPNLVALHGAGKTGDHCWLAMEFVDGESLAQSLRRVGLVERLGWRRPLVIAAQVARALELAASLHVIHRNVKPENILIRRADGVAKLGDLMLAKAQEGMAARAVTRPGEIVGDLNYMAPERTRDGATVDARSDIYGLGATLYALLTGRPPFAGKTLVETVQKIRNGDLVPPRNYQSAVPELFERIVLKMLARDPADRYLTATALLKDIEALARTEEVNL